MATQTCYAGTVTDMEDGDLWINENNAKTNDGLFSTCDISSYGITSILKFTNFGFTIPTGATINSILVTKKCKGDSIDIFSSGSSLYYSGGFAGGGDDGDISLTDINTEYEVYGYYGVLWGRTWTAAEINNSNFAAEIQFYNNGDFAETCYVDFVSITVDYTASGGAATPFTTVTFH